jgi:hypothetical protein
MVDHNWSEASLQKVCNEVCDSPIKPLLEDDYEAKCIQHYDYVWKSPRKEVITKLLEGWRTWDMYALTLLLLQKHVNLHYDAEKRLPPAASRFAA